MPFSKNTASPPAPWSPSLWQVIKGVVGFVTVTLGGYWLLRNGARLWSENAEAGALTLIDNTTGAPLPVGPFSVSEPFSGWNTLSEFTDTEFSEPEFSVPTSTPSEFSTKADDVVDEVIAVDAEARPGQRGLLSMPTTPIGSLFPAIIPLASLNGINGFKLDGEATGDLSGYPVNPAGDFNQDGVGDFLIGAQRSNMNLPGYSYVVYGGVQVGSSGLISLASLNGSNGFKLVGEGIDDYSGFRINSGQDINGDGWIDLLVSAPHYNDMVGRSYIVFGGPNVGNSGVLLLADLNGVNGFKMDGEVSPDRSGVSSNVAKDINGDGISDLLIGAFSHNSVGRSYVVFGGNKVGNNGLLPLSSLTGANGFKLDGELANDWSGWSANPVGDINQDGYEDFIIGAQYYPAGNAIGRSYLIWGGLNIGSSGLLPLATLDGSNGFKLDGEWPNDFSSYSIGGAGDVNGDGFPDFVIGAYGYNNYMGRSYVIFGGINIGNSGMLSLSDLNGTNGFKIDGEMPGDNNGRSVSAAGDINGDGIGDLIIGASGYNNNMGRTYVVFGRKDVGNKGVLSLASLDGSNGFKLDGEVNGDYSGFWVSGGDDINGDGMEDLLIGAYGHNAATGRSYVVFGDTSPQIWTNQLTIHAGESVVLTANNLNATGTVIPTFNVFNIQYGRFELLSKLGEAITVFNQSQILEEQIQFIHDGSQLAPSYTIQATNRIAISSQAASVTFYQKPILLNNRLSIHQGQTLLITPVFLSVKDNYLADQVNFTITNLQHGRFQLAPFNTSSLQFSQQQVLTNQVFFAHDGGTNAPSYQVGVKDSYFILAPASATITFYRNNYQFPLFPAEMALGSLDGINGFKLDGEVSPDQSGYSVSAAGDINGDGLGDLLIGAPFHASQIGRSYVVFGNPAVGSSGILALSNLNGSNGFKLDGEVFGDQSGYSVSTAGDINGDGLGDLLIGAIFHASQIGRSYVVFGNPVVGSGILALSNLNGSNGFKLDGEVFGDQSGWSVSAAGDINGDGLSDLLIGAHCHLYNSATGCGAGRSYVVFGSPGVGSGGILALSNLNGSNGFKLDGETSGDYSGQSVGAAGDINGDGLGDLLIGAPYHANITGRSYVIFGNPAVGSGGVLALSNLNGTNGFKFNGEAAGDGSGYSVSAAGDINGDGLGDLLIGAPYHASITGRSYVVFGTPGIGSSGILTLNNINGINGFKLDGEAPFDWSGYSVSAAGDINGDGLSDLLIGAFNHTSGTGRSYVVFGSPGLGSGGILALSSLNGSNGFKLDGETAGDGSGYSVSSIGDINGDGLGDLLIGAPWHANQIGRSYVVFGDTSQIWKNQLTVHSAERVVLTTNNLNATGTVMPIFNISNIQYGRFELLSKPGEAITVFNQSQILEEQVQFIHDGSQSALSYTVQATSRIAFSIQAANVTFYRKPVLVNNQLWINQGQRLLITPSLLSVTEEDYPPNQVNFTITNLQHGQFQLAPLNTSVIQFNEEQLLMDQVFFTHDGSSTSPSYEVSVSDPYFTLPPIAAVVAFYRQPSLVNNQLWVHQGQRLLMDASSLSVVEEDYPADQVNFVISNLEYGQFQLAPLNTSVMQFSERQLLDGQVFFIQDSSPSASHYQVSLKDPYFTLPPASATVTFYRRPVIVNNQLTLFEGQTLLVTSANINVTDDYPDTQMSFIISDCQQGQFELISAKNASTIQFTQQQVKAGQIQFVHNNLPQAPSYNLTITDGYFTLGPVRGTVTFTLVNKPPFLVHSIPPQTFAIGQAFNFKIAADTFYDEQNKPIQLSSTLASGQLLPSSVTFNPPTATFTGLVSNPEDYNISVTATSVADLTTTTFFMLQIAGQLPSSSWIDIKALSSVLGTIGGVVLTGLSYLYMRYHFSRKREFDHPFANAIHWRLNLSYVNFFDKEGKEYARLVDQMMVMLKTKSGVDIDQLKTSTNVRDHALYEGYADAFTTEIRQNVGMISVYCGMSKELRLRDLEKHCERIVDRVIAMGVDSERTRLSSSWCSWFCCRSAVPGSAIQPSVQNLEVKESSSRVDSRREGKAELRQESMTTLPVEKPPLSLMFTEPKTLLGKDNILSDSDVELFDRASQLPTAQES